MQFGVAVFGPILKNALYYTHTCAFNTYAVTYGSLHFDDVALHDWAFYFGWQRSQFLDSMLAPAEVIDYRLEELVPDDSPGTNLRLRRSNGQEETGEGQLDDGYGSRRGFRIGHRHV